VRTKQRTLRLAADLALALAPALRADSPVDESRQILSALALGAGMSVADVGAGEGRFTLDLARMVGSSGRVFATEVDQADLDKIAAKVSAERLANVELVLGDQQQTGLPQGCCDAILLRLVYHHFTEPSAMRRSAGPAHGRRPRDRLGARGCGGGRQRGDRRPGSRRGARDERAPRRRTPGVQEGAARRPISLLGIPSQPVTLELARC
jgi:SAM-dependent methyltransferase